MGKRKNRIAHFIRLAEQAGLTSDVPINDRNRSFIVRGGNCCLIMSDDQITLSFGETDSTQERPPQLVLRPAINDSWELTLEPADVEMPAEVLDFAKHFSLASDVTISVTDDDMLQCILNKIFDRVRPVLASAS